MTVLLVLLALLLLAGVVYSVCRPRDEDRDVRVAVLERREK